jgi:hypothetical protein
VLASVTDRPRSPKGHDSQLRNRFKLKNPKLARFLEFSVAQAIFFDPGAHRPGHARSKVVPLGSVFVLCASQYLATLTGSLRSSAGIVTNYRVTYNRTSLPVQHRHGDGNGPGALTRSIAECCST